MGYYGASISYDGTHFLGFQIQNEGRTVQGEIEKALEKIGKKSVRIRFAGRTDSHVHALENIIAFPLEKEYDCTVIPKMLNNTLPADIRVNNAFLCPPHFNPRYDSYRRVYLFVICNAAIVPPFYRNNVVHCPYSVDLDELNNVLRLFEGTHHFGGYTTSAEKRNPERIIYNCFAVKKSEFIYLYISGASFLHKQIRSITGAAFQVMKSGYRYNEGEGVQKNEKVIEEMKQKIIWSLDKGSKPYHYGVFKPQGLYLKKVIWRF